jgi:hypothetical protein
MSTLVGHLSLYGVRGPQMSVMESRVRTLGLEMSIGQSVIGQAQRRP